MRDTLFMVTDRNTMRLQPRLPFLLASLLFVTAVQATTNDPPPPGKGPVVSAPEPKPQTPGNTHGKGTGSRYGVGYEARHGIGAAGVRSERVDRVERPDRIERPERVERAERDDRGR